MKNKGFTLVELIAVIAIIGLIVTITIPRVSKIVEKNKKETFSSTITGIVKSAELYTSNLSENQMTDGYYEFSYENGQLKFNSNIIDTESKINDTEGKIYINNEGSTTGYLFNKDYCAQIPYGGKVEVIDYNGTCSANKTYTKEQKVSLKDEYAIPGVSFLYVFTQNDTSKDGTIEVVLKDFFKQRNMAWALPADTSIYTGSTTQLDNTHGPVTVKNKVDEFIKENKISIIKGWRLFTLEEMKTQLGPLVEQTDASGFKYYTVSGSANIFFNDLESGHTIWTSDVVPGTTDYVWAYQNLPDKKIIRKRVDSSTEYPYLILRIPKEAIR